eukprot:4444759-Amphidinium_carterae.1
MLCLSIPESGAVPEVKGQLPRAIHGLSVANAVSSSLEETEDGGVSAPGLVRSKPGIGPCKAVWPMAARTAAETS